MSIKYIYIGLALLSALALFAIYRTGYNAGRNSVTVAIQEKNIKDVNDAIKKSDDIDNEVENLGYSAIDRRLMANGWLRTDND